MTIKIAADGSRGACDSRADKFREPKREIGDHCDALGCRHKYVLRHTLTDAIEALESTRKAFKSKQIEALRKKLTRVLIEET